MIPLSQIEEKSRARGDQVAIVSQQGSMTWHDLARTVPQVVEGMVRTVDVNDLATVCFVSPNRLELVLAAAAAATLKITFCGLDYSLPAETLAGMVEAAEADCLIVSSAYLNGRGIDVRTVAGSCPVIDLDDRLPGAARFSDFHALEATGVPTPVLRPFRAISFTSGTSGQPKLVVRNASFDSRRFAYFTTRYGFCSEDRHLVTIPLYHAAGNGWARLFLHLGATVVLAPPDDPEAAADVIRSEWITTAAMTPPILAAIVNHARYNGGRLRPNQLKFVLVGGKHFPVPDKLAAIRMLGPVIYEYYGTTETGVNTIAEPCDLMANPASVGRTFEGNRILVVDAQMKPLPVGHVGRIAVSSYMNMDCYKGVPMERMSVNGDRYLVTPEYGHLDQDGYLFLMNRSQGTNSINLYELENAIGKLACVKDVALIPAGATGARTVDCALVLKPAATATREQMTALVRDLLKRERVELKRLSILKSIPYSPSGKVRVPELRAAIERGEESPSARAANEPARQKKSAATAAAASGGPPGPAGTILTGILCLLGTALAWGAMFPITKGALDTMDAFHITLMRYGMASVLFLVILAVKEGPAALWPGRQALKLFGFGSLGFAGFSILAFEGLAHTRPEHAAIIVALMPLITALMTWALRGVRPSGITFGCIFIALLGVGIVVTRGDITSLSGGAVVPSLVIMAGAFCWVTYTIGASFVSDVSPIRYTALSAALGTMTIGVATLGATWVGYIETPSAATVWNVKWELAYLIVIAGVMAVISWNMGIRRLGAVNGVLFINLVPITAFLIGFLMGNRFTAAELYGVAITIGALIVNNLNARGLLKPGRLQPSGVAPLTQASRGSA